jgi:radical SAM family uncharacterized protein
MNDLSNHPWLPFLHSVRSPSRYVGGEFGSVTRAPGSEAASLCLAFPDVYEVGMSHLGTQILYDLLTREDDLRVERCFSPWGDLEEELRARGLPLVSLETFTPLKDFDVVGISLQHELCFTNILTILDLGGIPLHAADRDDRAPIVLGGGPGALHPEPVAPFFDAFFCGEAEADLGPLLREIGRLRRAGATRREVWRALAARPGMYVPALYEAVRDEASGLKVPRPIDPAAPAVVRRVFVPDLNAFPLPETTIVPWNRAVFDRASLEVARGCSEGCRFCEAGYTYRPLRDRSPLAMLDVAQRAVATCGHDEVSLGALSPADYPALSPLVAALSKSLTPLGVTLSVSSLRAYGLSEQILRDLRAVRAAGLTLAPEAGTQRLRDVINKNVTDADLTEAARRAFANRWQRLKLYFMIGLPTETDEDAWAIMDLARSVLRLGRGMGRAEVTAAVGVFVPRPHTPFQWEGMAAPEVLDARQAILRDAARKSGVSLKLPDVTTSRLECVFARGDRDLARVIETAWRSGCRFDQWGEAARPDLWEAAFVAEGIDPEAYRRPIPVGAALPWEIIDPGVSRAFLRREHDKAMEGRLTAPCERPAVEEGERPLAEAWKTATSVVCHACGAGCDPAAIAKTRGAVVDEGEALAAALAVASALEAAAAVPEAGRVAPSAKPPVDLLAGEGSDPSEPAPVDGTPAVEAAPPPHKKLRKAPPPPPQEAFTTWHVRFTRVGRASYLSQIDIVKHLPRILRRAGLVIRMSGGYHPLPKLTYRDPMPVGYQSAGEWLDADLVRGRFVIPGTGFVGARPANPSGGSMQIDAVEDLGNELVAVLNAASVDGIRFLSAVPAYGKRGPASQPRYAFASPFDADTTAERLAPLAAAPLSDDEIAATRASGCQPDPFLGGGTPCVLTWPRERPDGRPHEVLTRVLGRDYAPFDLVRLYDDPRAVVEGAPEEPDAEADGATDPVGECG